MNEAVWVSGFAMYASMIAIVVLGAVGGLLLYLLDRGDKGIEEH